MPHAIPSFLKIASVFSLSSGDGTPGSKIALMLLSTDEKSHCRHKELLKSYVIDALDECFNVIKDEEEVIQFVEKQIISESPKTKKRAKEFLKKYKNFLKKLSHLISLYQ